MLAIIFGGSSGIGKAIAKKFIMAGYEVFICSRKPYNTANELRVRGIPIDITKEEEIKALSMRVDSIDVLVNSVGDLIPKSLKETSLEEWEYIFKTNVVSTFLLYKYFAPLMNEGSYWFNISSTAGLRPRPDWAGYSISKSALNSLTQIMAEESYPHILVNAIAAGRTDTPMRLKAYPQGELKETLLPPEKIADYIYAIVSNKIHITGQILEIKLGFSTLRNGEMK